LSEGRRTELRVELTRLNLKKLDTVRSRARHFEIRGRLAQTDEAVSSEEETQGRLAQLSFDDWLDRR
jgi:hypothetical protein